jgi:hypothetical protein
MIVRREMESGKQQSNISTLQIEDLKTALIKMDAEAVNKKLLEYANLSLDADTKGKIAEVEQHILMFEYEKAIEKINALFLTSSEQGENNEA